MSLNSSALLATLKHVCINAFHEGAHGVYESNPFRVQQRLRPLFQRAYEKYGHGTYDDVAPDSTAWPAWLGRGRLPTPLTVFDTWNYERAEGIRSQIDIKVYSDHELFSCGASTMRKYPYEFITQMRRMSFESPEMFRESMDIARAIASGYGNRQSAIFRPALLKYLKENKPRQR